MQLLIAETVVRHTFEHSNNLTNQKEMADNTDEEHLDNPESLYIKKLGKKIIYHSKKAINMVIIPDLNIA